MDEKQAKLISWLDSVEEYARSQGMPMRLIDRICECRSSICENDTSWGDIEASVKDILDSIELKRDPAASAPKKVSQNNAVSAEQIKTELKKVTEKCRNENEGTIRNYAATSRDIVEAINSGLSDIANVDANYDTLYKSNRYLEQFNRQCENYRRNLLDMLSSLLESISRNYDHMFETVRSMFSDPSARSYGISGEKLYHSYDIRKEGINGEALAAAEKAGHFGEKITALGKETCSRIAEIREKAENRRKKLLMIPALVIGAVIILVIVLLIIGASGGSASGSAQQENNVQDVTRNIADIVHGLAHIIDSVPFMLLTAAVIIGVLIVAYVIYGKMLRKKCDAEIKSGCRSYLNGALSQFRNEDALYHELDETLRRTMEMVDSKYSEIIIGVFSSANGEIVSDAEETDSFIRLKEEWAEIRQM